MSESNSFRTRCLRFIRCSDTLSDMYVIGHYESDMLSEIRQDFGHHVWCFPGQTVSDMLWDTEPDLGVSGKCSPPEWSGSWATRPSDPLPCKPGSGCLLRALASLGGSLFFWGDSFGCSKFPALLPSKPVQPKRIMPAASSFAAAMTEESCRALCTLAPCAVNVQRSAGTRLGHIDERAYKPDSADAHLNYLRGIHCSRRLRTYRP